MVKSNTPGVFIAAHSLSAICGVLALTAGGASARAGYRTELSVGLLVIFALIALMVWKSVNGSRAAWSFLISTTGVLSICTLFGSAKIRDALHIDLGLVLVFPFLFAFACGLLVSVGRDYASSRPVTTGSAADGSKA